MFIFAKKTHFSLHLFEDIYIFSCLLFFLKTRSHFGDTMRRFSIFFLNFSGHKIADMILTHYF